MNATKGKGRGKALVLLTMMAGFGMTGQNQIYDNFDGTRLLHYGERTGVLDTNAKNPAPDKVNSSGRCGLYVRNGAKKFANIKMNLPHKLIGVDAYATYVGEPPQLKMKVFTAAPPGTLVEILLGSKKGNNDYPAGTHSQYQAYTTKSNAWEELTFKFSQIPQGSETSADQIDQLVLLFNPNSSTSDTYYFDDLSGPPMFNAPATNQEEHAVKADSLSKPTGTEKKPITKKTTKTKGSGDK
jgi:hypothetical protein